MKLMGNMVVVADMVILVVMVLLKLLPVITNPVL